MASTDSGVVYLRLLSELLWFEMPLGKNLEILDTLLSNADDPVKELWKGEGQVHNLDKIRVATRRYLRKMNAASKM